MISTDLDVKMISVDQIIPYKKNPRKNNKAVPEVMKSIDKFGFRQPLVLDKENIIVVGHTRFEAAKNLGYESVPCHIAENLSDKELKAYRIMDNRASDFSDWDLDMLKDEFNDLDGTEFDNDFFSFDLKDEDKKIKEETWDLNEDVSDMCVFAVKMKLEHQPEMIKALEDISAYIDITYEVSSEN